MIEYINTGSSSLAAAARAAAYSVEMIDIDPNLQSTRELILMRYAKPPASGEFNAREISAANNGPLAMWADCITDVAHSMARIAGFDISSRISALQVVRLGLPAPFDIGINAKRGVGVLDLRIGALSKSVLGNEFWLNFDIHTHQVAKIPLTVNDGKFVIDPAENYKQPNAIYPKLADAIYQTATDGNGTVKCVIT